MAMVAAIQPPTSSSMASGVSRRKRPRALRSGVMSARPLQRTPLAQVVNSLHPIHAGFGLDTSDGGFADSRKWNRLDHLAMAGLVIADVGHYSP